MALLCVALWTTLSGGAAAQRAPAGEHWVATWGTAQQTYRAPAAAAGPGRGPVPPGPASLASPPTTPPAGAAPAAQQPGGRAGPQRRFGIPPPLSGLNNQSIRMIVRASIGGTRVRVRLTHAFGASALTLGAARIAVRSAGAAIVPGSDRVLTFSGQPGATMYAGQIVISDPVALPIEPLADLAVSLYFPGETGAPTTHTFGLRPTYVSEGDATAAADWPNASSNLQSYYWLAGVDVLAPAAAGTLVTFGDSITDGDQSTPDSVGMWPAVLAARLQRSKATAGVGVVNAGISGNRVLGDNNSGLARFARDVLTVPGVRWITVMEGINDITAATRSGQAGSTFTAETLIAAYRQMIELAHLHGVKVIGCTLTPYGESNVYTEQGEAIRQAVNGWIRTSRAFDAVFDFDAATRDPSSPSRFRAEADSPDMLHPGNSGYALMAQAVDLSVFTRR
jgi:lysophospholipase L1-like esterase